MKAWGTVLLLVDIELCRTSVSAAKVPLNCVRPALLVT